MKIDLPLIENLGDPNAIFETMKASSRSGAVLLAGDRYWLLKAPGAFRAVRNRLDLTKPDHLRSVAQPLAFQTKRTLPAHPEDLWLVSAKGNIASIDVGGFEATVLQSSPATCYCPEGHRANGPGDCGVCGKKVECL